MIWIQFSKAVSDISESDTSLVQYWYTIKNTTILQSTWCRSGTSDHCSSKVDSQNKQINVASIIFKRDIKIQKTGNFSDCIWRRKKAERRRQKGHVPESIYLDDFSCKCHGMSAIADSILFCSWLIRESGQPFGTYASTNYSCLPRWNAMTYGLAVWHTPADANLLTNRHSGQLLRGRKQKWAKKLFYLEFIFGLVQPHPSQESPSEVNLKQCALEKQNNKKSRKSSPNVISTTRGARSEENIMAASRAVGVAEPQQQQKNWVLPHAIRKQKAR